MLCLAFSTDNQAIHVFSPSTGSILTSFKENKCKAQCLLATDAILLAAQSSTVDNTKKQILNLWSYEQAQPLTRIILPEQVSCITGTPSGLFLAVGTTKGSVYFWDMTTGKLLCNIQTHFCEISSIALAPDCSSLIAGGVDGFVCILNQEDLFCIYQTSSQTAPQNFPAHSLAVTQPQCFAMDSSLQSTIFVGCTNGSLFIVNFDVIDILSLPTSEMNFVGKSNQHNILPPIVTSQQLITKLPAPLLSLCCSDDGCTVVTSSSDGIIRVWDIPSLTCIHSLSLYVQDNQQGNSIQTSQQLSKSSYFSNKMTKNVFVTCLSSIPAVTTLIMSGKVPQIPELQEIGQEQISKSTSSTSSLSHLSGIPKALQVSTPKGHRSMVLPLLRNTNSVPERIPYFCPSFIQQFHSTDDGYSNENENMLNTYSLYSNCSDQTDYIPSDNLSATSIDIITSQKQIEDQKQDAKKLPQQQQTNKSIDQVFSQLIDKFL
ncbi:MAG: hypothetical protein EZS28_002111 [Streblomastix strix]|uniref:Uncharacterized protein n=1 Tax=Streblomastix strix TaxID=222440 RepID=A0A5J4X587_9EUKA|nr:MAG: hypothetical protein EZS28_002111 [Streblomastix strix]